MITRSGVQQRPQWGTSYANPFAYAAPGVSHAGGIGETILAIMGAAAFAGAVYPPPPLSMGLSPLTTAALVGAVLI